MGPLGPVDAVGPVGSEEASPEAQFICPILDAMSMLGMPDSY